MRVLLGISGGIAAYKSAELVRRLQQRGHSVQVAMTRAAQAFVTPTTLATLSGAPVLTDLFGADPGTEIVIEHIAAAQAAEAAVVAPATAHVLARMAHGLADDYLTTLLLATPAPVVAAPAMNVQMWRHPATQANLSVLRERGVHIVDPEAGFLACGMEGEGRMADLDAIVAAVEVAAALAQDLAGETVLITAGPTREPLDPVRYLTNRSSGRMGYALAEAARRRGARVILVSGPSAEPVPAGVELARVVTADEMAQASLEAFPQCTLAILAAAVADYRPVRPSATKIKKHAASLSLDLERTPDILASLGERKRGQLLIGFAAETEPAEALANAREKLRKKNADLVVLNDVSRADIGFDVSDNAVTLVTEGGAEVLERASKLHIAHQVLDAALRLPRHAIHHA